MLRPGGEAARLLTRLIILLAVLPLAGCSESYSWHQKITVTVDTPQGPRSGSSVARVTLGKEKVVPGHPGGRGFTGYRGEAVVVEVLPGRYLFALIGDQEHLAQKVFADRIGLVGDTRGYPPFEEWAPALSQLRTSRPVPRELIPLLVTFADINDPTTVRKVDPTDLAASFGPGVRLHGMTLEITDEKVTRGRIRKLLGWLSDHPEPKLGPATHRATNIPFYRRVSHGDFSRG